MPSVVGQYYMSCGIIGVMLVGIFYGLVSAILDHKLELTSPISLKLVIALTVAWLIISYRGIFPGFHYPVLLAFIILKIEKQINIRQRLHKTKYLSFRKSLA